MKLESSFTDNLIEAGLDEVGRGCLAGPVVASFVILPKDYFHPLINDSKQLSIKKRLQLSLEIEKEALDFAIAEVSNEEIDQINILNSSILAMHRALDKAKLIPELLLVDGNKFKLYRNIQHQCIIKGDTKYFSIAAASILAKTYRDQLMLDYSKNYPEYGWERNSAYPTLEHYEAIGKVGISPLHRNSFKLFKNI